ncbi:cupin domain-containing protein [Pseudonocardia sp. KRD291]|uniref:cupin domain-containing protein n=1 Tax=Pseudonocardia sp. KRD291 TaxID=2792007 RepID=UPI001C4A5229|nr:cupin domain-containing protein [Pseudonocardia sp. KRD291]MBW0102769.1 cupin domain-containing protein [Pseudonocardia sp. KRD291]
MTDPSDASLAVSLEPRFPDDPGVEEVDCSHLSLFEGHVTTRIVQRAGSACELTVMATRFAAAAGTVWHSHTSDQTLVVVSGAGRLEYPDHVTVLQTGDVVTVPAGREHRHRSASHGPMTHLSVTTYGGPGADTPPGQSR